MRNAAAGERQHGSLEIHLATLHATGTHDVIDAAEAASDVTFDVEGAKGNVIAGWAKQLPLLCLMGAEGGPSFGGQDSQISSNRLGLLATKIALGHMVSISVNPHDFLCRGFKVGGVLFDLGRS